MKCLSVIDGKLTYLKWHVWRYVSRYERNPSRPFKRHWSRPVTESALPSRIWKPDKVDYLASLTLLVVIFLFVCVCAELLQKEQESEHLPNILTQLISSTTRFSGASRKNNHCLNALSVCCPFGCSVTAWPLCTASHWITLTYHAWLQQSSEGLTRKTIQVDRVYADQLIFSL